MDRDDVIALVRAIGGPDRADPVCPQGDMITLDVDEVVRLVNIAAAQQFDASLMNPTKSGQDQTQAEQASEPVARLTFEERAELRFDEFGVQRCTFALIEAVESAVLKKNGLEVE